MLPFGTEKNISKPYCLPALTGWTAQRTYTVWNVKARERSDLYLYDRCFLSLI